MRDLVKMMREETMKNILFGPLTLHMGPFWSLNFKRGQIGLVIV